MSNTILLTGGTGFLGSYIIKQLIEDGYQVRAIKRPGGKLPAYIDKTILDKVEWVEGDVLDISSLHEAMQNVETIIHAAAVVSFAGSDRKEMYQVNVDGTINVVNLALENNIQRLVYISSVAALGRTSDGMHVDETKQWEENAHNTHYARSKHKAELEVWRAMGEGLNAVILNPATILGFGNWNNGSSAIFRNIHDGFKWYSEGTNGFVDVEDVARASVLLMRSDIADQRFIISGDNWTFKKLMFAIADCFGVKRPYKKATPALSAIAWRLEKLKSFFSGNKPLLTKESSRVAQSNTYFLNDKLKAALPQFVFTPLNNTIEKACKNYCLQNTIIRS